MKRKLILLSLFSLVLIVSCNNNIKSNNDLILNSQLNLDTKNVKLEYKVNEHFNSNGLKVFLLEEHEISNKINTTKNEVFNYELNINNSAVTDFTFLRAGEYKVDVSYSYNLENLTNSFVIYVYDEQGPNQYTDPTLVLNNENEKEMKVSFTNYSDKRYEVTEDKSYYSPSEVSMPFTYEEYGVKKYINQRYLPSTGNVPLLVVPVILPGADTSKADQSSLDLIEKTFAGNSSSLYFESLHSYYYKSSYGQLNFTFKFTDYFNVSEFTDIKTEEDVKNNAQNVTNIIANNVSTWVKDKYKLDMTKFDSNNDGFIDGLWLISVGSKVSASNTYTWAFTTSTTSETGDLNNPVVNIYGWAPFQFLNEEAFSEQLRDENASADAHVLIHETGHMLGLTDYYSYGTNSNYSPLGKADMMDNNVGDQNAYSKLMLGWIKPYIANTFGEITLKTSNNKDNIIVFPYDSKTYQKDNDGKVIFNPFDEYLIIEFYTPNDLNSFDYSPYMVSSIKDYGIKIYHVDNRLAEIDNIYSKAKILDDPDNALYTEKNNLIQVISNTDSGERAEKNYTGNKSDNAFDEIRLISSDINGYMSSFYQASSDDLFLSGFSFDINTYSSQFPNGAIFDNNESFSFTINFE